MRQWCGKKKLKTKWLKEMNLCRQPHRALRIIRSIRDWCKYVPVQCQHIYVVYQSWNVG